MPCSTLPRLQLFDATTGEQLPRVMERAEALARAEKAVVAERQRAAMARQQAMAERQRAEQAEAELARLRAELNRLHSGD